MKRCEQCSGTGWIRADDYEGGYHFWAKTQCPECRGRGQVGEQPNGLTPHEEDKLAQVKMRHGMEQVGYCYLCGDWALRRDVRQEERDETCVYVCMRDGSEVDEHPPFA